MEKKWLLITKNGISQTENFGYRVGLGLQRVFNLQTKGLAGWDGFISENIEIEF